MYNHDSEHSSQRLLESAYKSKFRIKRKHNQIAGYDQEGFPPGKKNKYCSSNSNIPYISNHNQHYENSSLKNNQIFNNFFFNQDQDYQNELYGLDGNHKDFLNVQKNSNNLPKKNLNNNDIFSTKINSRNELGQNLTRNNSMEMPIENSFIETHPNNCYKDFTDTPFTKQNEGSNFYNTINFFSSNNILNKYNNNNNFINNSNRNFTTLHNNFNFTNECNNSCKIPFKNAFFNVAGDINFNNFNYENDFDKYPVNLTEIKINNSKEKLKSEFKSRVSKELLNYQTQLRNFDGNKKIENISTNSKCKLIFK